MIRSMLLLVVLMAVLSSCEQEDLYGIPPVTNNELSAPWSGEYHGTCVLTLGGSMTGQTRPIMLRIRDVGDNYIRVKAYLVPTFWPSEQDKLELPVLSATACRDRVNVVEQWWFGNFNRSGNEVRGSIAVYPISNSINEPDWVISGIIATRE